MRAASLALILLAFAAPSQAQRPAMPGVSKIQVTSTQEDPVVRLTVQVDEGDLEQLMQAIVFLLNDTGERQYELIGFETLVRRPIVDVFISDRSWREVVRWVLGSAGLTARITGNTIRVLEESAPSPDAADIFAHARNTWQRVVTRYPEHPDDDEHLMALAQAYLGSDDSFTGAAIVQYEDLMERHPESDRVPEALLRSAELYAALGNHRSAVIRLSDLCDRPDRHGLHAVGRRELARNLCHVGESEQDGILRNETAERAIHVLGSLDVQFPDRLQVERRERAMLRAWALTLTNRPIEALRAIDLAATYSEAGERDIELLEVRGKALTRAERHGEASRCWLGVADGRTGPARVAALVSAAESALAAGQELGALAIAAIAEREGLRDLEPLAREAEARLGLLSAGKSAAASQLLTRGKEQVEQGNHAEGLASFRRAWSRRAELKLDQLQELAVAHARALDRAGASEEAHGLLRDAALAMKTTAQRAPLYRLAAELLENRGQFERAIQALKGEL